MGGSVSGAEEDRTLGQGVPITEDPGATNPLL